LKSNIHNFGRLLTNINMTIWTFVIIKHVYDVAPMIESGIIFFHTGVGGSDDWHINTVALSFNDHFLAHQLLGVFTMEKINPIASPVGEDHLMAFGAIIHAFARHETLMVSAMSIVANADFMPIAMLTAELPYRSKRDTFKAMIKAKPLPADQIERINWFLGQLHSKTE
jgi:hypothetical protein